MAWVRSTARSPAPLFSASPRPSASASIRAGVSGSAISFFWRCCCSGLRGCFPGHASADQRRRRKGSKGKKRKTAKKDGNDNFQTKSRSRGQAAAYLDRLHGPTLFSSPCLCISLRPLRFCVEVGMTSRATAMSYTVERATRASRSGGVLALILVAFLATFPAWADHGWMREFNEMACYLIFAMMWNLLAGYGGMVSIGQQAFLGIGGYALLVMGNFLGVNPFVAVPLAAAFTMLVALPVSKVAFRLQGGYFAIGTWVIAEV